MGSKKKAKRSVRSGGARSRKKPVGPSLVAGERYYRRDWNITDPLIEVVDGFNDSASGFTYNASGKRLGASSGQEEKHDLLCCVSKERSELGFDRLAKDIAEWPDVQAVDCGFNELNSLLVEVIAELNRAQKAFPPFNSLHEGMSVLREEVDELWDEVKKKQLRKLDGEFHPDYGKKVPNLQRTKAARAEAIQVIAMALRLILDNCTNGEPGYGK